MQAWRLCRALFADLSGEGARLVGGRWNSPGQALVYLAQDAALAVLEVRVHLDLPPDLLPEDYVLVTVDLGGLPAETVQDIPPSPARLGDGWIRSAATPLLRVPSAIVPESRGLLLNPAHPSSARARVVGTRRFTFDPRLWQSTGAR